MSINFINCILGSINCKQVKNNYAFGYPLVTKCHISDIPKEIDMLDTHSGWVTVSKDIRDYIASDFEHKNKYEHKCFKLSAYIPY